jgi:3-hydroxybutyryl-CoA dehydratase
MIQKRSFQDFSVGEQVVFSRTFTEIDVAQCAGLTWDVNPYHTDDEFCKTHRVGHRIVHGLLVGSMITHIGGLAAVLATDISFEFIAPVYIGDTVTATCTILESDAKRGWVRFDAVCTNQHGDQVLRGIARGYPARFRDQAKGN